MGPSLSASDPPREKALEVTAKLIACTSQQDCGHSGRNVMIIPSACSPLYQRRCLTCNNKKLLYFYISIKSVFGFNDVRLEYTIHKNSSILPSKNLRLVYVETCRLRIEVVRSLPCNGFSITENYTFYLLCSTRHVTMNFAVT